LENVTTTQKSIAKRVFVVNTLAALIGFFFIEPYLPFLTGVFFGTAIALLNFRLLFLTIDRAVRMNPERAPKFTVSRYMVRYALTAMVIIVSLKSPDINALGSVIGLITIKGVILQRDLLNDKRYFRNIFTRKEEK